jgi:hypothetical protein
VTLYQPTEAVVACDACGFAGLVGPRCRDWVAYQMAATEERWVRFAVCTVCGVTCVGPYHGGPLSRQPGPLRLGHGPVLVAEWQPAAPASAPGCPACGDPEGLLWSAADEAALGRARCPACWAGPLRLTDRRASHPGW